MFIDNLYSHISLEYEIEGTKDISSINMDYRECSFRVHFCDRDR